MGYEGNWPKNKDEWWGLVDEHWSDLLNLLYRFIGMNDMENVDGQLTETPRAIEIEKMRTERDCRLVRYFNGAWGNAPDVPGLSELTGWNLLCDLCSEEHVLYN
jgi:hypothetical protein